MNKTKVCTRCKKDLPLEKFALMGHRRSLSCNVCNYEKYQKGKIVRPVYISKKDRGEA